MLVVNEVKRERKGKGRATTTGVSLFLRVSKKQDPPPQLCPPLLIHTHTHIRRP